MNWGAAGDIAVILGVAIAATVPAWKEWGPGWAIPIGVTVFLICLAVGSFTRKRLAQRRGIQVEEDVHTNVQVGRGWARWQKRKKVRSTTQVEGSDEDEDGGS